MKGDTVWWRTDAGLSVGMGRARVNTLHLCRSRRGGAVLDLKTLNDVLRDTLKINACESEWAAVGPRVEDRRLTAVDVPDWCFPLIVVAARMGALEDPEDAVTRDARDNQRAAGQVAHTAEDRRAYTAAQARNVEPFVSDMRDLLRTFSYPAARAALLAAWRIADGDPEVVMHVVASLEADPAHQQRVRVSPVTL